MRTLLLCALLLVSPALHAQLEKTRRAHRRRRQVRLCTTCRWCSPSGSATSRTRASTSASATSPAARARSRRWSAAAPTWWRAPTSTPSTCSRGSRASRRSCSPARRRRSASRFRASLPTKYKSPKDLKGLKVGVSAPGSSTNMVVNYLLAQGGLKPTDVAIIGIGAGASVIAAMDQGRVDVVSQTDPAVTMLEKDGKVKVIAETRTPEGTQKLFGGPMPASSLYAPLDFIKKNPNTVQALTNATVRTLLWMQDASPQQILAAVPRNTCSATRRCISSPTTTSRRRTRRTATSARPARRPRSRRWRRSIRTSSPPRSTSAQTYTNEFVKKAHAKYGKKK